jgi:hypothetical protein
MTPISKFSRFAAIAGMALVATVFTACEEDDLNSPVITLEGGNVVAVRIGTAWTEPGATAEDVEDGPIGTINVDATGFNTNVMGTYSLLYSAVDEAGNTGTAERIVNVYVNSADLVGSYTVNDTCDGGIVDGPYTSNVANSVDSFNVIIDNFWNSGVTITDGITLSGDLNDQVTVDAAGGGATFVGSGTITSAEASGGSVAVTMKLGYTTDDGTTALFCNSTLVKN